MKSINHYINESIVNEDRYADYKLLCQASKDKNKMYFSNQSALMMYTCEFAGQISDGEWENTRPEFHWLWIVYTNKYEFAKGSQELGYVGVQHKKSYNLNVWLKYMKDPNQDFSLRTLKYAKFGSVIGNSKIYDMEMYENLRTIIEELPDSKEKSYKEFIGSLKENYLVHAYEICKSVFTEENYDNYYESKYDMNDFKNDLEDCKKTVNTYLGSE